MEPRHHTQYTTLAI